MQVLLIAETDILCQMKKNITILPGQIPKPFTNNDSHFHSILSESVAKYLIGCGFFFFSSNAFDRFINIHLVLQSSAFLTAFFTMLKIHYGFHLIEWHNENYQIRSLCDDKNVTLSISRFSVPEIKFKNFSTHHALQKLS